MLRSLLVLSLSILYGCSGSEARPESASAAAPSSAVGVRQEAPQWSREGLEVQPRMEELRQRTPPELGFAPATTPWRPARESAADELVRSGAGGAANPDALLARTARVLDERFTLGESIWERTTRIWRAGDDAIGVILNWGLQDDSVAGHDFRIHMRRDADGCWMVERLEERFHCARGVTADGLCI